MPEDRFWVIRCKVCSKYHRANPPLKPGVYQLPVPMAARVECPNNPGMSAEYFGSEWLVLSRSDLDALPDE